ncbi:hypothetical protein [Haloferula helveola]
MNLRMILCSVATGFPVAVFGQGALTPDSPTPAPTMKSLQEIWDKLCELDERVGALESDASDEASSMEDALAGLGEVLGATTRYNWSVTTIDSSTDDVGKYASLAISGDHDPAIAYYNATDRDLLFIEQDGSTWDKETIDSYGYAGVHCSLAFSDDGHAGIAYQDESDGALNFACRYEGSSSFLAYRVKSPDASQVWGTYNSLAFAPNGRPYIAHRDQDALKLYVSYLDQAVTETPGEFTSANWNTFSLMADLSGYHPSLDFKSDGRWGISHGLPGGGYNVQFIEQSASGWSFTTPDSTAQSGQYTSAKFNSSNKPGIAYYDQASGSLKYASKPGSGWSSETVDASANVGKWCSLAFTTDDRPAIAYYDSTNGDLKYAERNSDGGWKVSTVDSDGDVGQYASLALGRLGRPWIAYYDVTNGNLKFAKASSRSFVAKFPQ